MSLEENKSLFTETPLEDLAALIEMAKQRDASRLLLLAGKYPVCRIGQELSPLLTTEKLHFSQTELLARALLTEMQEVELDGAGSIEIKVRVENLDYQCSVFFGNGSHNFIVFLA